MNWYHFKIEIYFKNLKLIFFQGAFKVWEWAFYHVRYLSHLALQVGFSNWVHKTRINSIQRWRHFGTKTRCPAFFLEKWLHPSLYSIWYSWSGSTIILDYINLSVSWDRLLRNHISLCKHIFYYTFIQLLVLVHWTS